MLGSLLDRLLLYSLIRLFFSLFGAVKLGSHGQTVIPIVVLSMTKATGLEKLEGG